MELKVQGEYITLQQLLKACDFISSGGESRWFLQEHRVLVNGEEETRRGKKLYPGDQVEIEDRTIRLV